MGKYDRQEKGSLGYLFGAGAPYSVTEYETDYLLYRTADGYYEYNSADHAADYSKADKRFYVREYKEYTTGAADTPTAFLPFNYTANRSDHTLSGSETDYWFGMTMTSKFIQPADGKVDGNPMIFEFSGDDDVWVFIDDVLVLDLGGIHGPVSGSIDFSTGTVTAKDIDDNVEQTTTIRELFEKAGVNTNFEGDTFADYSNHTIKFFYLERGAGGSNCKIRFNLATIPEGELRVGKQITEAVQEGFSDAKFVMKIEVANQKEGQDEYNNLAPYEGEYTICNIGDSTNTVVETGSTNNGTITLKNGQYAKLTTGIKQNTKYRVTELDVYGYDSDYEFTLEDTDMVDESGGSVTGQIGQSKELFVNVTPYLVVQNQFKETDKYMFVLQKKMEVGQSSDQEFSFTITNSDGDLYTGKYYVRDIGEEELPSEEEALETENGVITLKQNQEAIILGVTSGSNIVVKETVPNGYSAPSYTCSGNCTQVTSSEGSYQIEIKPSTETTSKAIVTCTNSYATGTLTITKTVNGLNDLSLLL